MKAGYGEATDQRAEHKISSWKDLVICRHTSLHSFTLCARSQINKMFKGKHTLPKLKNVPEQCHNSFHQSSQTWLSLLIFIFHFVWTKPICSSEENIAWHTVRIFVSSNFFTVLHHIIFVYVTIHIKSSIQLVHCSGSLVPPPHLRHVYLPCIVFRTIFDKGSCAKAIKLHSCKMKAWSQHITRICKWFKVILHGRFPSTSQEHSTSFQTSRDLQYRLDIKSSLVTLKSTNVVQFINHFSELLPRLISFYTVSLFERRCHCSPSLIEVIESAQSSQHPMEPYFDECHCQWRKIW